MTTATTIAVAVWLVLLLGALVLVVFRRERVYRWITALDHDVRGRWDLGDDDVWAAFVADHPELTREDPSPKR